MGCPQIGTAVLKGLKGLIGRRGNPASHGVIISFWAGVRVVGICLRLHFTYAARGFGGMGNLWVGSRRRVDGGEHGFGHPYIQ